MSLTISTQTHHGVRIILELARSRHQGVVSVGEISRRQDISVKYLEQLIRKLKQAGFITSTRGPKGGHQLAIPPDKITIGQIVSLFEGQTDMVKCINTPQKCERSANCPVRQVWKEASECLNAKFDNTTIADLL
jgi:Rrf2 family protein